MSKAKFPIEMKRANGVYVIKKSTVKHLDIYKVQAPEGYHLTSAGARAADGHGMFDIAKAQQAINIHSAKALKTARP